MSYFTTLLTLTGSAQHLRKNYFQFTVRGQWLYTGDIPLFVSVLKKGIRCAIAPSSGCYKILQLFSIAKTQFLKPCSIF